MSLEDLARRVRQLPSIEWMDGDYLPAPRDSGKTVLFINCIYKFDDNRSLKEVLEELRANTNYMVTHALKEILNSNCNYLCISFFWFPTATKRVRIYRYTVRKDELNAGHEIDVKTIGKEVSDYANLGSIIIK